MRTIIQKCFTEKRKKKKKKQKKKKKKKKNFGERREKVGFHWRFCGASRELDSLSAVFQGDVSLLLV